MTCRCVQHPSSCGLQLAAGWRAGGLAIPTIQPQPTRLSTLEPLVVVLGDRHVDMRKLAYSSRPWTLDLCAQCSTHIDLRRLTKPNPAPQPTLIQTRRRGLVGERWEGSAIGRSALWRLNCLRRGGFRCLVGVGNAGDRVLGD